MAPVRSTKAKQEMAQTAISNLATLMAGDMPREAISTKREGELPHYVIIDRKNHRHSVNVGLRDFDGEHPVYDDSGKPIAVRRILNGTTRLDISLPHQRATLKNLEDHPIFRDLFDIKDEEKEAVEMIKETEDFVDAVIVVRTMQKADKEYMREFSRLFQINPDKKTDDRVYQELFSYAKRNPDEVLKAEKDPATAIRIIVKRATQRETIRKENGMWMYEDVKLGTTQEEVFIYLDRNDDVLSSLDASSKRKEKVR